MIKSAADLISQAQKEISCVDIEGAKKLIAGSPGAVILDVREGESVAESRLSDSTHVPRGLLEMKVPKICPDPDTLILTHCGGGGRASLAALTLQHMGYKNIHAIAAKYEDLKKALG